MNVYLLFLVVAQLGEGVTAIELEDFYKANGRPPKLRVGTEMRIGDVGVLPYGFDPQKRTPCITTKVLQVLSDDSELLSVEMIDWVLSSPNPVNNTGAMRPKVVGSAVVMVKGVSTRNVADDDRVQLGGWWKTEGTETYESALGKRTVWVIRRFRNDHTDAIDADMKKKHEDKKDAAEKAIADAKAAEEAKAAQAAAEKQRQEDSRRESYRRTWKSKDGMFSVDAYFIDQSLGSVVLERAADGKQITVSASSLSAADIDHARILKLKRNSEKK